MICNVIFKKKIVYEYVSDTQDTETKVSDLSCSFL